MSPLRGWCRVWSTLSRTVHFFALQLLNAMRGGKGDRFQGLEGGLVENSSFWGRDERGRPLGERRVGRMILRLRSERQSERGGFDLAEGWGG